MPILPKNAGARAALRLITLLVLGYVLWCGAVYSIQGRLIFPRDAIWPPDPEQLALAPGESWIEFTSPEGQLVRALLWMPLTRATSTDSPTAAPLPLAILIHGNAELVEHFKSAPQLEPYKNRRFAILVPEFRGYGAVPGTPSQSGITRDLIALHDHLSADPRFDLSRVVIHGRSLGAGFASDLALARPPRAIVLESTFTSIASYTPRYLVPEFLCAHPLRNDRFIASFPNPSLIVHGTLDEIIPVSHARQLARLAKDSTYLEVPDGTHLNLPTDFEPYDRAIGDLLIKAGIISK